MKKVGKRDDEFKEDDFGEGREKKKLFAWRMRMRNPGIERHRKMEKDDEEAASEGRFPGAAPLLGAHEKREYEGIGEVTCAL